MADEIDDTPYQEIHVQGIGKLRFPENMSPEDMEKAIKEHPDYEKVAKYKDRSSSTSKFFGGVNDLIPNMFKGPDLQNPSGFGTSAVKGIPILGNMVAENPEQTKYEQENPILSKTAQIGGGVASTLPLAAGVAARSAAGMLPQAFNQGMLGTTLGLGNELAEKGRDITGSNINRASGLGFAGGFGASMLGRALTPTTPSMYKIPGPGARGAKLEPNLSKLDLEHLSHAGDPGVEASRQMLIKALRSSKDAAAKIPPPIDPNAGATAGMTRAAAGALLSHLSGMGTIPGAIAGYLAPKVPDVLGKINQSRLTNQLMNRPMGMEHFAGGITRTTKPTQLNRYLLNALGEQMGQ